MVDENVVEAIQKQVEAKYAEIAELKRQNDLNEASLKEVSRLANAEKQRVKLAFDTNDKVSGLLFGLSEVIEKIRHIDDRVIELRQWLERTDDILMLLLTEKSPHKVQEAIDDLEEVIGKRQESHKKLIRKHTANLSKLKEQAAGFGVMNIPLDLQNQIEAEEAELDKLLK